MSTRSIQITPQIALGGDNPPLFIAGPCVIESREHALAMARTLRKLRDALKINLPFDDALRAALEVEPAIPKTKRKSSSGERGGGF